MIEILNIVKGAVATKDLIPILTHFHLYDKRIQGNNGKICIDAPLDTDLNVTVPADKFYRAVKMCGAKLNIKTTPTGRLSMTCGKFRALLTMLPNESFPKMEIKNDSFLNCEGIIPVIKKLKPFISDDASRQWSRSILFKDGYAWATNNVIVARIKVNFEWEGAIPVLAINEIIRLNEQPLGIAINENYVCFKYNNDVWLRATTCGEPWPEISSVVKECDAEPIPKYFIETLNALLPFCEDPKYPFFTLGKEGIHTDSLDTGASVDLTSFPDSKFRAENLINVANIATHIAFSSYPNPCYFKGDGIDGALVGVL